MTSGIVLGIGLCFHNHAPQQTSIRLAFHQPAANQLRGNELRWTAEEGLGQGCEIVGDGVGGYENGYKRLLNLKQIMPTSSAMKDKASQEKTKKKLKD